MIFNSIEQIKSLIENPVNSDIINRANYIRIQHELHVSGIGLDCHIDKIQGIENTKAVSLRRALGQVITLPEMQKIISVINKIFSARGGGRYYDFSNERDQQTFVNEKLADVKSGMSIQTYMKKVWKELVCTDPSGIIMSEIDSGGKLYLSYKTSQSLHDIGYKSATHIEYIIFKPTINEKENSKLYRVIDDQFDYTIQVKQNTYTIVEELTFPNYIGFVPAMFISDRFDKQSNCFDSHISEALIYANDMLLDYTIYKIYKTKIGIPAQWQYERECAVCEGSGQILLDNDYQTCHSCNGNKIVNYNRDVADIIILPLPEGDDVPLTPPLGYVIPDLESWKKYEETIEMESRKMYESIWGQTSTIERDRRNITASELTVRDNGKENKLNEISDNEENIERRITDIFGLYYFPNSYQKAIIRNGRHYDLRSVEELQNDYNIALTSGVPSTQLNDILANLFYTLYKNTPQKLNENIIKLYTKPFYHWNPERILTMQADRVDYYKNLYYDEFAVYYDLNLEKFGVTTIEKVQKALDIWILSKMPKEIEDKEDNQLNIKENE